MSGGQQMTAALALHLALVHTYARNCDVLFLDEPTTHLDAKRRRALAETLRSLRSRIGTSEALVPLRQMFLISHDDAFEGLQDQVIRVVAGSGEQPSTIEGAAGTTPSAPPMTTKIASGIRSRTRAAAFTRTSMPLTNRMFATVTTTGAFESATSSDRPAGTASSTTHRLAYCRRCPWSCIATARR